jgi:predicted MPP superfamily phosphohydrolase
MRALGRLGAFGGACFLYGLLVESQAFRVRRFSIPVLPKGAGKIRVLHISDAHLLPRNKKRIEFIESLAGLEPDLVVCTGDMVSSSEAIDVLKDALGRLAKVPGVFVFGSSDYIQPEFNNPLKYVLRPSERKGVVIRNQIPTDKLEAALSWGGWINLNQARHKLTIRGTRLEFRGTDDAHLGRDDYPEVAGKASKGTKLSIGVTHAPYTRLLNDMTSDGVELIFAGHTHGGQVRIPIYGALTTNCDIDRHRAQGLSTWEAGGKKSWLHVSAGFGSSPYAPYRFACPPEVSLITLKPVEG